MSARINHTGTPKATRKPTDSTMLCDHCKITWHTTNKCFVHYGYPDWHRFHGQPKPKLRNMPSKAKPLTTANSLVLPTSASDESAELSDFSDKQYQKTVAMLQAN